MDNLSKYIDTKESKLRIQMLTDAKKEGQQLSIGLVDDLLYLNIPIIEKISLLSLVTCDDSIALEHFLLSGISKWDQDLAAFSLRKWMLETDHLLWFRLISAATDRHIAQRVQYTILDQCSPFAGKKLIEAFQNRPGLEDLSPAFHSLIIQRSLERDMKSENIDQLAFRCIEELTRGPHPDNKALTSALGWVARYHPEKIDTLKSDRQMPEAWRNILVYIAELGENTSNKIENIKKQLNSKAKTNKVSKLVSHWLPLSLRHKLDASTVSQSLRFILQETKKNLDESFPDGQFWKIFSAIPSDTLTSAINLLKDDIEFAKSIGLLSPLLETPLQLDLFDNVIDRLSSSSDPAKLLESFPLRLRLELTQANNSSESLYKNLFAEEKSTISQSSNTIVVEYPYPENSDHGLPDSILNRQAFFGPVYKKSKIATSKVSDYWGILAANWESPDEGKLAELASSARQSPEIFKLCYVETLGRYKGYDSAALKLLDFIRSNEENVMLSVINSLSGIGTPRAIQELISCMTRPNITPFLRLEICNRLQEFDLSKLQSELRSAIEDLNLRPEYDDEVKELIDAITNLLVPITESPTSENIKQVQTSGKGLDTILSGKIPHYSELSSEVKRALRTAQFFHNQIKGTDAVNLIDLSPVIDMQYKALELLFRESFEETAFSLINDGILQRKLDVLGYARPIPKAMDEFERYIGGLPIINSIPYFSKFKLRKMLRAICQFRPGKRFTLDGIKAFSLFFICFGRSNCRYGLSNIIDLGFSSEEELFQFGKALHIFQDFRNRAAHEGFHPDAHNDIDGIWQSTCEIVQNVFEIKKTFTKTYSLGHHGSAKQVPIIERKAKSQAS